MMKPKWSNLRHALRTANPDIVYVALGFPKAELLIHSLRNSIPTRGGSGLASA
jgi:UDP-N-acetyl-D-mannosaminuronic acid transferase (WecB/TagA/CpsF family)